MITKTFAEKKVYHLHSLEIDKALEVLWYIYRDFVKENITPEPERPHKNLEKSERLIEKVMQMSPEDQLQLQRDLNYLRDVVGLGAAQSSEENV